MRPFCATLLAPAMFAMNACVYMDMGDIGRYSRDFHYNYPLSAGSHISVEGFNGGVEITPWDQATVDVSGVKHGPNQTAVDTLRVDFDRTPTSISIHVVRPSDPRGNFGVRFAIKIPRGAILDRVITSNGEIRAADATGPARLKTTNGAVRVEKFHGDLDIQTSNAAVELEQIDGSVTAHSSNGHIRIDRLHGALDAETSNNSIKAALENPTRQTRAETRNGSIDLTFGSSLSYGVQAHTSNNSVTIHLTEPVNARLSAHTSNSEIDSEFEAHTSGNIRRNEFEGTIGSGGPLLDLSSSNGPIRVTRN